MRRTGRSTAAALSLAVFSVLAALTVSVMIPAAASASIYEFPPGSIASPTNPGIPNDYKVVWREGWGNSPLANLKISIPGPSDTEPAIVGAYYYLFRPSASFVPTMNVGLWPSSYNAVLMTQATWDLYLDLPGEVGSPGPLFNTAGFPPAGVTLGRPYEGPFGVIFQFYAKDVDNAARGGAVFGLDVTPPAKVTGLKATPGFGDPVVNGWLTQSRVHLDWDDIKYDTLSGTGYFEVFMDGKPYPTSATDPTSRRVYDLKEHYPGYGFSINTRRTLTIEDLPAGQHRFQVRAVDRATNPGPLSDPVIIQCDPDIPEVEITSPEVDGQTVGARPTFTADVTDLGGVAAVEFYVDGVLRATDLTAPYSASVDLGAFANGSSHTLRVQARDVVGRTNFAEKSFVIDKLPQLSIVSPSSAGQLLGSPALLSAVASDGAGIASVTFAVNGAVVDTYTPQSANATSAVAMALAPLPTGVHTLVVSVTNIYGVTTSLTRSFRVDASLPVSILSFLPSDMTRLPSGTSTTNPYTPGDAATFWRELWGNSLQPNFVIESPSFQAPQQAELFYTVDRAPVAVIDPSNAATYYRSVHPKGTELINDIDQLGVLFTNPAFNGIPLYGSKVTHPVEGVWYLHLLYQDGTGALTGTLDLPYGVDVTPPSAVTSVGVYMDNTSGGRVTNWIAQDRVVLRWNNAQQDLLSGTAYYRIYANGKCIVPGDPEDGQSTIIDPAAGDAGVPWYRAGRALETLTIETGLGSGKHSLQVSAVDRAGNEGARSAAQSVWIDSDVPRIAIKTPSKDGALVGASTYLSAIASDTAGIRSVNFAIDGVSAGTVKPAKPTTQYTATLKPNWSKYSNGTHVLTATVTDMVGRTTSVVRSFRLDRTPPRLTVGSKGPNPFYPRLQDGYKDNYTIKFKSSETGTATLSVYDSRGRLAQTIKKKVTAGKSSSLSWNGSNKYYDWTSLAVTNPGGTYKFKVKISVVDVVGNKTTKGSYATSVKFYELVKTSGDTAMIMDR